MQKHFPVLVLVLVIFSHFAVTQVPLLPILGRGMKYNNPSFMAALQHSNQSYPLVGYRFHPTHEELINNYLKPKMLGHDHDESVIREVDFCKSEPWQLAKLYPSKDNEGYFLSGRDRKYKNKKSSPLNRTTAAGHWKPTGKVILVKSKSTKKQIGTKRTLVFYKGRSNSKENRTGWIAHEYELFPDSNLEIKGDYTLIKLKKKSNEKACVGDADDHQMALSSNSEGDPSDFITYDYQYTTGMTADSTCNAGEPSHLAFDNENQSSSPSINNSACDENKPNLPTDFDLGGQDSTEMVVSSACNDGEPYYNLLTASENHDPSLFSASYRGPMDYDPENQTSLSDFETNIPVFIIGSNYDKGEPCSRKALAFGNQNQDNNYDISCCIEGDKISPAAGTAPNKENDTSILDENSSSFLNSLPADDSVAAWLSKVSPELVAELKAMIEPEREFNSINQSSCAPKEAPSAMAMDPFVSSGCLLWNSAI